MTVSIQVRERDDFGYVHIIIKITSNSYHITTFFGYEDYVLADYYLIRNCFSHTNGDYDVHLINYKEG